MRAKSSFLSATVEREAGGLPTLRIRHHDVAGVVVFEDRILPSAGS
jgi:hypothetical protein